MTQRDGEVEKTRDYIKNGACARTSDSESESQRIADAKLVRQSDARHEKRDSAL